MNAKKYIIATIVLISGLYGQRAAAQTPGFVQQDIIKVGGITTDTALYHLGPGQRQTSKVYVDGMGRQLQAIAEQASPTGKDIIQPVVYDNLGRQTTSYLPYAGSTGEVSGSYRSNAISTGQPAFYNQTSQYLIAADANPYSQQVFENSPLQRVLSAGMAGSGFQPVTGGHYKKVSYRPDSTTDGNILLWYTNGTYSGTYYASKTLHVTDAIDEDNVEILTFTDKAGHTVLKRQKLGATNYDTYYIYNNAGMISYVIPPLATTKLAANSYSLTVPVISSLLFKYIYDGRGRLTQRIIPAKGVMYIVYDPLNRPVLMQDSNMRVNKQWNYIKYDAKGRTISQGIYTDGSHTTLTTMQSYVSGLSYSTYWYETRTSSATYNYYTNNVFPTTGITALAYAYFDDYYMTEGGSPTFSYAAQHDVSLPGEESPTTAYVKEMPTMVTKTTVGAGLTGTWLTSVVFYDHNLRVIQIQSNNQLNYTTATTLTDVKTIVNDFTGMPLTSKVTKKRTSTDTVSVYTAISYDLNYRPLTVKQKYNTGSFNPVAAYNYNELGQLILKNLGYVNSTTWLQNVDFRFNIRGWLLSINNSKLTPDGGKTNSDNNDVFGMQLAYDKADSSLANFKRYNGKPSAVKWMTRNYSNTRTRERSFTYSYNALNRYVGENYAERDSASTGASPYNVNVGAFNEKYIVYDANGNLTALSRSSTNPAGGIYQIDTLKYTYSTTSPDQLTKVTDAIDSVHQNHGFRNLAGGSTSYTYDGNGNLTADPFKGITKMTYNVLNRTDSIKISSSQYIIYFYDADGNLIRKKAYLSGTLQTTTDYIDGFVYLTAGAGTPALSYFPMPEGRVLYSTGTFTQEFVITDQQGNARVSFRNVGGIAKVFQENSYYGTGLILPNGPVSTPSVANKKLYNGGSEWQNDYSNNLPDYYQTLNRNYDASIGRFIGVDPMAESAESMTSYQYAGNNPIVSNDPNGDLLDINRQNRVQNLSSGPTGSEFDNQGGGSLASFYGDVAGATGGYLAGSGAGLYYTDPEAYWEGYYASGGTFGGATASIYHAGNKATGDRSTGSLAQGVSMINSIASATLGHSLVNANTFWVFLDGNGDMIYQAGGEGNGGVHYYGAGTSTSGGQTVVTSFGEVANQGGTFYPDGSAFFTNETQAYNYMWKNSNYGKSNYIENFAFITKNGVAVLPTHGTKSTGEAFQNTGYQGEWYGVYQTKGQGSTFAIDFHGIWIYPIASIHTHPGDRFGDNESPDGYDLQAFRSMGIPGFVLGHDHFYGVSLNGNYSTYPAQNLLRGIINIIPNIGLFK